MFYAELLSLTDDMATYEQFLDIEAVYMRIEGMTKAQAAHLWRRRYGPKADKPRPDEMRRIKENMRNLKHEREFLDSLIHQADEKYRMQIDECRAQFEPEPDPYHTTTNNYFLKQSIQRLEEKRKHKIYSLCDDFGGDASFHFIYKDGRECCISGTEIVAEYINPPLQHIAYAYYLDGYEEFDTLIGEWPWDISEDDQFEERSEYETFVQIKYGTKWGIKFADRKGKSPEQLTFLVAK